MSPLKMLSLLGWVLISGKEEKNATSRQQILKHKEEVCPNAWDGTTESPEIQERGDNWQKVRETWQLTGPAEVHGYKGKSLSLCCHYQQGFEDNTKDWCKIKGGLFSSCESLISSDGKVNMDRVSLRENKKERYFQVTMDNLNLDDSGIYRCDIVRLILPNMKHRVNVTVSPDPEESLPHTEISEFITSIVTSTHSPVPREAPQESKLYIFIYSIIPLFVLVLLASVVLLGMSRKKKAESRLQRKEELNLPERRSTNNTEDNHNENTISDQPPEHNGAGLYRIVKVLPENDYEEIHSQEKTSEEQDEVSYARLDISDHHCHIYSNVNLSKPAQPEIPAQEVFYTEVKPDH